MLLDTMILMLQEIFEVLLLVSIVLVLLRHLSFQCGTAIIPKGWLPASFTAGMLGAWLFAVYMQDIARVFDYRGLEFSIAALNVYTVFWLLTVFFLYQPARRRLGAGGFRVFLFIAIVHLIAMGIIREGAEIILYLQGVLYQPDMMGDVLKGTLLAVVIGFSLGLMLYVLLINLPYRWPLRACMLLLVLFGGNMASQSVAQLTQADWLPALPILWDVSGLVAEYSVTGQLLYALTGYDANPTLWQMVAYGAVAALVLISPLFRAGWQGNEGTLLYQSLLGK